MTPGVDLDVEALLRLRHLAARMRDIRTLPRSTMPGDIIHKRRGRGLEVHDVRPWVEGDDIRHLDQTATARTGVPHTKTYFDERERSILLVADFRPSMLFGTRRAFRSVAGAEALAMLGWRGVGRGGRVGCLAATASGTQFSRQGRGERAMIAHVGLLAEAHRAALADREPRDPPLAQALETIERLAGTGSTIVVATALDAPGRGFDDVVLRLTRKHDVVFLLVEDAFEAEAAAGRLSVLDGRGRERLAAHRQAARLRRHRPHRRAAPARRPGRAARLRLARRGEPAGAGADRWLTTSVACSR